MPSLADLPNLTGFFSYSRKDDQYSQDSLSRLRDKIRDELYIQLGRDVELWKDSEAIRGGAKWEGEINRAISQSAFFIPIVTPSLVASNYCLFEIKAFLNREKALGRDDLIFPLLYVWVPALKSESRREHPILSIVEDRQYVDWRDFRHRELTEPATKAAIAKFCRSIVESLQQPWISPADRRVAEEAEAQRVAQQARDQEEKKRQQADAEARRQAEKERQAEAEAQRRADQQRRREEGPPRQEARTQPQDFGPPRKGPSLNVVMTAAGMIVLLLLVMF